MCVASISIMEFIVTLVSCCLMVLRPIASYPSDIQRSLLFPLFTPSGGKSFDDGTYAIVPPVASVQSLTIYYGDYIDGLRVVYVLQDGQAVRGAWHGGAGGNATHHMKFGDRNEVIVRVEGYSKFGPPNGFLTQLNFFTKDSSGKIHKYGPIGEQSTKYRFLFNFAGVVIGFFWRKWRLFKWDWI